MLKGSEKGRKITGKKNHLLSGDMFMAGLGDLRDLFKS